MRLRLGRADSDVILKLACCQSRSMLIFIEIPMAVAGIWKIQEIDRINASLYRKVLGIGNMISFRAILYTLTNDPAILRSC
jgi:hypothetical protein